MRARMVRDRGRAVLLVGLGAVAFVLGAVAATSASSDRDGMLLIVVFAAAGVALLLMARRGVRVDDAGVTIVRALRRRFIEWDEVVAFRKSEVRNRFGERVVKPVVMLRSGEECVLDGVSPHGGLVLPRGPSAPFPALDELDRIRWQRSRSSW